MTDKKDLFYVESSHETYEQYSSAFQEQPDTEQYSQYSSSGQQPQYSYASQQALAPHTGPQTPPVYTDNPTETPKKNSPIPVITLVLGLVAIILPPLAIPAIILGIIGMVKAKKTGVGKRASLAGYILGLLITAFWIVAIIVHVVLSADSDRHDDYIYGEAKPSVSDERIDIEFGAYGKYDDRYGVPVTVTNNSSDLLDIELEVQAQTKKDKVVDEYPVTIPALRPGYSYTTISLFSFDEMKGKEIEKSTYVTTEIDIDTQEVVDTKGLVTLGDLAYEKEPDNVRPSWDTSMEVVYANTSSTTESCSFTIVAQDPNTKETLGSSVVSFLDIPPGQRATQPAFQAIDFTGMKGKEPWFTREGLEYDIVDMNYYKGKEHNGKQ